MRQSLAARRRPLHKLPQPLKLHSRPYPQDLSSNLSRSLPARPEIIVALMEECWVERSDKKQKQAALNNNQPYSYNPVAFSRLVDLLESVDYQELAASGAGLGALDISSLDMNACFWVLKVLNTWISELFAQRQLPQQSLILSTFYKYFFRSLRQRIAISNSNSGQDIAKIQISHAYFLNNMGLISIRIKQYRKAVEWFEQMLNTFLEQDRKYNQPVFAVGFCNLATVYNMLGQYLKAEECIEEALGVCQKLVRQQELQANSSTLGQQNSNFLAHVYTSIAALHYRGIPKRLSQIQQRLKQLIYNGHIKLGSSKNWYIRYYFSLKSSRGRKKNGAIDKHGSNSIVNVDLDSSSSKNQIIVFERVFSINISELRFVEGRLQPKEANSTTLVNMNSSVNRNGGTIGRMTNSLHVRQINKNRIILPSIENRNNHSNSGLDNYNSMSMLELASNSLNETPGSVTQRINQNKHINDQIYNQGNTGGRYEIKNDDSYDSSMKNIGVNLLRPRRRKDSINLPDPETEDNSTEKATLTTHKHLVNNMSLQIPRTPIDPVRVEAAQEDKSKSEELKMLSQQNIELKSQIQSLMDVLVKRQNDTQKVIQTLILPKMNASIPAYNSEHSQQTAKIKPVAPNNGNYQGVQTPVSTVASHTPLSAPFNSNQNHIFNENSLAPMTPLNSSQQTITFLTFKNLRFSIEFYEEGIKIKSFTGNAERLDWSILQVALSHLQLLELFETRLMTEKTQHQMARTLFHYLSLQRKALKFHTHPLPTFEVLNSPKYDHRFFFQAYREFKIFMKSRYQCQGFVVDCIMCKKSFAKYFSIVKNDEYIDDFKSRLGLGSILGNKKDTFVEVAKLKDPEAIAKDLADVMARSQSILDTKNNEKQGYTLINLHFDSLGDSNTFLGALYWANWDDKSSKVTLSVHSLQSSNLPTLVQTIPYTSIQTDYGVDLNRLSVHHKKIILRNLCSLYPAVFSTILIDGKVQPLFSLQPKVIEVWAFRQTFIHQKYMRPFSISVIGFQNRCHGLKLSFYNQALLQQESMFVVSPEYHNEQEQEGKQNIKNHFLCKLLGRMDLGVLYEKWKKREGEAVCIMSLQQFLEEFSV